MIGAERLAEGTAEAQGGAVGAGAADQRAVHRADRDRGQGGYAEALDQLVVGVSNIVERDILYTVPGLVDIGTAREAREQQRVAEELVANQGDGFVEIERVRARIAVIDVRSETVVEAVVVAIAPEGVGGVVAVETVGAAAPIGSLNNRAGGDRDVADLAADVRQ